MRPSPMSPTLIKAAWGNYLDDARHGVEALLAIHGNRCRMVVMVMLDYLALDMDVRSRSIGLPLAIWPIIVGRRRGSGNRH